MGTKIEYTSLYGDSDVGPVCGLLQIDGTNILLDCGWDDQHDTDLLKPLEEIVGNIDAVLLSHPDPLHIGALPYLVGKLKLNVPVYATTACHRMGQMFLYDQILSWQLASDFDRFSLDDVDAAFGLVRQVKYQQQVKLKAEDKSICVTAFAAGHLIGGAIWQVQTESEEQIVYATHWNHSKDKHLRRADLVGRFSRPAVFITDACSALRHQVDLHKRNAAFLEDVTATLRQNGNVLVPTDTAGRLLELLLVLENHWLRNQLRWTIVVLTRVAQSTLEFAKSQLEWMNQDISDQFTRSKTNPFEFRHVKVCNSKEALQQLPKGPKVVLSSLPSLQAGLSRQMLVDWAPNPANLILFTTDLQEDSLGYQVQNKPEQEVLRIQMQIGRRVPLEGEELRAWQEKQRAQLMEAEPLVVDQNMEELEEELGGSSPLAPDELPGRASTGLGPSIVSHSSGMIPAQLSQPVSQEITIDGFDVPEGSGDPMFPSPKEEDREWTDYGLSLKPGDFRLIHEDSGAAYSESDPEELEEVPTRVVVSAVEVNVRATVKSYAFDGLTDQHSIVNLLTKVAPRHLIIAFGSPKARQVLLETATKAADAGWQAHRADNGCTLDVSAGSSSYKVVLSDALMEGLQMRTMGSYRLAWLNAVQEAVEESNSDQGTRQQLQPDVSLKAHDQHGAIYIGDVKLSALRKALGESGISADFQSGMLVCQNQVIVKPRAATGQLTLEGPVCEEYYQIRAILNGQFHIC